MKVSVVFLSYQIVNEQSALWYTRQAYSVAGRRQFKKIKILYKDFVFLILIAIVLMFARLEDLVSTSNKLKHSQRLKEDKIHHLEQQLVQHDLCRVTTICSFCIAAFWQM